MRVTREKAAAHRAAIVGAASRLFRARGLDRVGVAEITREAGLTHGGFYGHFASKDALAAEAVEAAFAESQERLAGTDPATWVKGYLSRAHRDHPESGCPLPALTGDILRAEDAVARRFAAGFDGLVAAIAGRLPGPDAVGRRDAARDLLAGMVGGLALARVLARVDVTASDRLLRSLRERALARLSDAGDDGATPASPP